MQSTSGEASQHTKYKLQILPTNHSKEYFPPLTDIMEGRMDRIWYKDLDEAYEKAKAIYPQA